MGSIGGRGGPFFWILQGFCGLCVLRMMRMFMCVGPASLGAGGNLVVSVARAMSRVCLARVYRPNQNFWDNVRGILGLCWDHGK